MYNVQDEILCCFIPHVQLVKARANICNVRRHLHQCKTHHVMVTAFSETQPQIEETNRTVFVQSVDQTL